MLSAEQQPKTAAGDLVSEPWAISHGCTVDQGNDFEARPCVCLLWPGVLFGREEKGVIESLRLEKISKIIKSNHQPNTTMPTKPCPEVPYLHGFWTLPGKLTPPLPWTAYSNAWPLFQ